MALIFDYSRAPTQPLGKVLVKEGVITPEQLKQALEIQRERPDRIGRIIVKEGFASEEAVLEGIARHFRISARTLSDDLEALIRQRPLTLKEKLTRVRVPIRVKLSIAVTFIIWATILILSFIVLARQKEQLYRQTVRAGKISLNYFVNNAGIPLLNDDLLRLNTMIKEAASVEGLVYAIIVNREQIIKAHSDHTRIGTPLPAFSEKGAVQTEGNLEYFSYKTPEGIQILDLSRPVIFMKKELGAVHV
ncbi:MAG: hypothetical protein AB1585_00285, partial [Thermodesulfobacteriota bacterium]